jgi:MFS family permease
MNGRWWALCALMLPAGLLGDRFGRRRMLITGPGVFLIGPLVGAPRVWSCRPSPRSWAAVRRSNSGYGFTTPCLSLAGIGFGFSVVPAMDAALGALHVPAAAADRAGDSVVAAHVVAERLGVQRLADSANLAYVHGMSVVLPVIGAASLVTALLVGALLTDTGPSRTGDADVVAEPVDA